MTERPLPDSSSPESSLRPFAAAPAASRYFPAVAIDEARQRVGRSLERGEGPALVIGGAGVGKTMLLEVLAEQFRDELCVVPLAGAQLCTRRALLQMILFEIGLPYRGLDEGELRLSVVEFLRPGDGPARRVLLLVDEADSLPTRLLEELRVLTNIADEGRSLVSVVLLGSSTLEETFADPKLEVFSQRVSTRCYLAAMGREETIQYVRAQIAASGGDPDELFAEDGLEALFAATDGVPRLVNQLGDQLMWLVEATGDGPINAQIVQQAWSELQQLPAPWNTSQVESTGSDVEYGELGEQQVAFEPIKPRDEVDNEVEDDLPASIPFNTLPQQSPPSDYTETFDATEQLVEQLDNPPRLETDESRPAHNPFAEVFETEEVIADHYPEFDTQLFHSAPRVVNRVDTAFAEELRQLEVAEQFSTPEPAAVEQPSCDENASMLSGDELPPHDPCEAICEETVHSDSVGDLLVVEEADQPTSEVVAGARFRQLFSSLESAGGAAV